MRAYALRHYGIDDFHLRNPKVIVEHYTATDTLQAAYATFANDVPDAELHELPGTCAHFIVDKDGTIYQLVALTIMCRHTVGLNWTAFGIEQVGLNAREIVNRPAQYALGGAPHRVAALSLRHRPAQRHRPQREPVEPLPPRERRRSAPPDARRLDARRDDPGPRPRRALPLRALGGGEGGQVGLEDAGELA